MKIQFLLSEKTLDLHYNDQPVNVVWGNIIAVYCENHMQHANTLCGQNAEFLNVTAGGTYSNNHWALQD
jgi:hypothetical protein